MEDEDNRETVKIDIHVSGKGKIKRTVQDGERECLLEGNIEAEPWINQVMRRHESKEHQNRKTSTVVCIYRVPESIKKIKREAYDPLVVFLGPYHHKKHQQLTAMDEYKLQAVDRTLERLLDLKIDQLVSEVEKLDTDIRDCYEDSAIEWDKQTLAWMMTMDACFILEVLRMELPNSSLFFRFRRQDHIKRREIILDILKLENQIPLCVLKKILELEFKDSERVPGFLASKLYDLGGYFQGYPFSPIENEIIPRLIEGGARHLLDLSRQVIAEFLSNSGSGCESTVPVKCCACNVYCCASTCVAAPPSAADESLIPSAEKLQRAGIKLKLSSKGKFHFKRRRFRDSILFLPQIIVEDDTEIFLRNLVAFEECQRHLDSPINRVISLNMYIMDNLIDSKEDVGLFQRANIIKNYLGTDEEVAHIFNDLCIGISYKDDFKDVLRNVNEHYNSQVNVWISEFRKEHCSRPWYIVSFVAAALLLVMTLLQTIYTMQSYFRS